MQLKKEKMEEFITVDHISFYDYKPPCPFDGVYFSASLMLMPDPVDALMKAYDMLAEDGRIYCTQTFEEKKNKFMEKLKPLIKFFLTIDFGQVTYVKDFEKTVDKANLKIEDNIIIGGSKQRSFRLMILTKKD